MKTSLLTILLSLTFAFTYADAITVKMEDRQTKETMSFIMVNVEYPDTVDFRISDSKGIISFTSKELPLTLKAGSDFLHIQSTPDSVIVFSISPKDFVLEEVEVVGALTTLTESGLSYNMSANKRAQGENALQALSYVPLVKVDMDGKVAIQGASSCSIYLNGRPYEMAQTSPKTVLESLPASSIAKVEVITQPDNRLGADAQKNIINIVLRQPMLDGYVLNLNGGGNTQPSADASIMGIIRKHSINASLNYAYNINGQRHQPADITYTEKDLDGATTNIWKNKISGNGNWHTHTLRALLKWEIDSLNILYADAHGSLAKTDITGNNIQSVIFPSTDPSETHLSNISDYLAGSTETNLIFRNYFKDATQTERITIGYHYTYNPDKRHFTQYRKEERHDMPEYVQQTDGGLHSYTGLLSYLFRISTYHSLRLTASDTYRRGNTTSSYRLGNMPEESGSSMKYTNNIAALSLSYSGWIRKVYCSASVKANHDVFSMKTPQTPAMDYERKRLYLLPSLSFFWRPSRSNTLYLNYSTSLTRPDITMLNPFESTMNDHSINKGNPDLKAQYNHLFSFSWYNVDVRNLTLAASIDHSIIKDAILPDHHSDDEKMVYSFSNFGHSNQTNLSVNLDFNPLEWISMSLNCGIGNRCLRSNTINRNQNNITYRITPRVDFLLPHHFRIGAYYGYYKNLPDPWSSTSALNVYFFYADKSFMAGQLHVSVSLNSPFNRYNVSKVTTTLPTMTTEQNNYMTARSFGLSLSYSLGAGKKVKIDRDRTLESSDQDTGVR